MVFAIYQHESAMGVHVSPHAEAPSHLPPHLPLWVVPEYWLCVPCLIYQLALVLYFMYGNIHKHLFFLLFHD